MRKFSRILGFLVLGAGFLLLPAMTMAAETNENPGTEFGGQWIWAFVSLVIVVILAYWVTRFVAGKFNVSQARHIKVAESLCLGPNRHLYLLLVNNQVLLVGGSEHGINLLKEYDDANWYELLNQAQALGNQFPTDRFKDILTGLLKKEDDSVASGIDAEPTDSKQRLMDGLERIRSWRGKRQ